MVIASGSDTSHLRPEPSFIVRSIADFISLPPSVEMDEDEDPGSSILLLNDEGHTYFLLMIGEAILLSLNVCIGL